MDQMMNGLTRKQEAFVLEYVKDYNATQAAIRAGYSKRRASEIGYQLLQKTTVLTAIEDFRNDIHHKLKMEFMHDAIRAREVLYEVMASPTSSDRDKIVAAKDLLDRAGFKAIDKHELNGRDSNHLIEIKFIE